MNTSENNNQTKTFNSSDGSPEDRKEMTAAITKLIAGAPEGASILLSLSTTLNRNG